MATISPEMEAMLTHAEKNGLCLWEGDPDMYGFDRWEELLWSPEELRQAIIGYKPPMRYEARDDKANHSQWHIVDPQQIYEEFQEKADEALAEAESFKECWIDKTKPVQKRVLK
jgi:hypothetical protein